MSKKKTLLLLSAFGLLVGCDASDIPDIKLAPEASEQLESSEVHTETASEFEADDQITDPVPVEEVTELPLETTVDIEAGASTEAPLTSEIIDSGASTVENDEIDAGASTVEDDEIDAGASTGEKKHHDDDDDDDDDDDWWWDLFFGDGD